MEAVTNSVPIYKVKEVSKAVPTQKCNGVISKEPSNNLTGNLQSNGASEPIANGAANVVQSKSVSKPITNGATDVVQSNSISKPITNGKTDVVQSNGVSKPITNGAMGNGYPNEVTNGALHNGSSISDTTEKASEIPSFLEKSHIHIADPDRVNKIILNIIQDGPNKLQIIADWDYTVTIGHINGNKALSSWDVMEESSLLPASNREQIQRINEIHMKAEFDHSMTPEEKKNDTIKWYRDIYDEVLKSKLTKETVADIVKTSGLQLREKSEKLFEKLNSLEIPTMVVSAGFGDFILEIIKLYNINCDHIRVISNFFIYNKQNTVAGFTDPIYPYNKKEHTVNETQYYKKFIDRSNAILIGDTVGDAKMDGGIIKKNNILKIGFLNGPEKNPEYLKMFKQYFDIVVEDDQTMDPLIAIIDAFKL